MSWRRILLWVVLTIPAVLFSHGLLTGEAQPHDLYHPTGELSVRLMLLTLLPGPLAEFFGAGRFLRGWLRIRRNLGVAAFGYGMLHLALYVIDMQTLAAILEELPLPAIWTAWLSIIAMAIPAALSFDGAMRALKRRWKQWQRFAYPAFALALLHWGLLDREWGPALVHLAPLLLVWLLRGLASRGIRMRKAQA